MRADARRNRERLIAAALAAFAAHGADNASLEEIAKRAGLGIGTLYRHFPTRQALLESVYRDQVEALCEQATVLLKADSPAEALGTWLRALVDFSTTKRSMTTALMASLDKDSELISSSSTALRSAAQSLLARAQRAGEIRPDADATDLLRLSHAIVVATERPSAHPDQTGRLLGLMLDGLRTGSPGSSGQP